MSLRASQSGLPNTGTARERPSVLTLCRDGAGGAAHQLGNRQTTTGRTGGKAVSAEQESASLLRAISFGDEAAPPCRIRPLETSAHRHLQHHAGIQGRDNAPVLG